MARSGEREPTNRCKFLTHIAVTYATLVLVLPITFVVPIVSADQSCGSPQNGGHLRIGERFHPNNLDPHRQLTYIEFMNHLLMYNGLVDFGSMPKVDIKPGLAESWEISPDGLTYTFRLRDAKFHNGKDLTAADVKYSLDRIRNPETRSPKRLDLFAIKSIEVVDKKTVRLHLTESYGPLLYKLTVEVAPIIPEGTSYEPGKPPPGTGPFIFEDWKLNQYTQYRRNPNYWEKGLPHVDKVTVLGIEDPTVRLTALRKGEIDWLTTLPLSQVKNLQANPPEGVTIWTCPPLGRHYLVLNTLKTVNGEKNPFADKRVRQAVAYALNKETFLQGVNWGYGRVLDQAYDSTEGWYVDVPANKQDIAKAKALLAEAGYPNGFSASIIASDDAQRRPGSQITADQLKKIGINLEIKLGKPADINNILYTTHQFHLAYDLHAYSQDPDYAYFLYLHSKSPRNTSGFSDPEFDKLLEKARALTKKADRKVVYAEIVKRLLEDSPMIYIMNNFLGFAWRKNLKCDCGQGEENCWEFPGWFSYADGGFKRVYFDR